jgi:hypothetical protein
MITCVRASLAVRNARSRSSTLVIASRNYTHPHHTHKPHCSDHNITCVRVASSSAIAFDARRSAAAAAASAAAVAATA